MRIDYNLPMRRSSPSRIAAASTISRRIHLAADMPPDLESTGVTLADESAETDSTFLLSGEKAMAVTAIMCASLIRLTCRSLSERKTVTEPSTVPVAKN